MPLKRESPGFPGLSPVLTKNPILIYSCFNLG